MRVFEKEMRQIKNRKTVVEALTTNIRLNSNLRDLVRKPSLNEIEATTHGEVLRLFEEFLGATEAGNRVTYILQMCTTCLI